MGPSWELIVTHLAAYAAGVFTMRALVVYGWHTIEHMRHPDD